MLTHELHGSLFTFASVYFLEQYSDRNHLAFFVTFASIHCLPQYVHMNYITFFRVFFYVCFHFPPQRSHMNSHGIFFFFLTFTSIHFLPKYVPMKCTAFFPPFFFLSRESCTKRTFNICRYTFSSTICAHELHGLFFLSF